MPIPEKFREKRIDEIAKIIQDFTLACIVGHTEQGVIATHILLVVRADGVIVGHMAL